MELRCLEEKGPKSKFCSIEPITLAALIGGGTSLLGSGLSFLGQSSSSSKVREAMERYLQELKEERNVFLSQPESQAMRAQLGRYTSGQVGYPRSVLGQMKAGVYEDYGKSLADMSRMVRAGGAGSSGVYTPGRSDRVTRQLGQNIAANRANTLRDVNIRNAEVALNNQRFAASALPTYLPGTPSTTVASPDVFLRAGETPSWGSYLGPAVSNLGQMAWQYPIMERMLSSDSNPYANLLMLNMLGPQAGRLNLAPSSLYPTQ